MQLKLKMNSELGSGSARVTGRQDVSCRGYSPVENTGVGVSVRYDEEDLKVCSRFRIQVQDC